MSSHYLWGVTNQLDIHLLPELLINRARENPLTFIRKFNFIGLHLYKSRLCRWHSGELDDDDEKLTSKEYEQKIFTKLEKVRSEAKPITIFLLGDMNYTDGLVSPGRVTQVDVESINWIIKLHHILMKDDLSKISNSEKLARFLQFSFQEYHRSWWQRIISTY